MGVGLMRVAFRRGRQQQRTSSSRSPHRGEWLRRSNRVFQNRFCKMGKLGGWPILWETQQPRQVWPVCLREVNSSWGFRRPLVRYRLLEFHSGPGLSPWVESGCDGPLLAAPALSPLPSNAATLAVRMQHPRNPLSSGSCWAIWAATSLETAFQHVGLDHHSKPFMGCAPGD